jgi:hypothetical protein
MTPDTVSDGEKWTGPLAEIVGPLTKSMIIPNKVRKLDKLRERNRTRSGEAAKLCGA